MKARYPHSLARQSVAWPVVASGLWLRLAFVAGSLIAYGIATLASGDMGWPAGLLVIAGSLAVAVVALRRSYQALGRADADEARGPLTQPSAMRAREA